MLLRKTWWLVACSIDRSFETLRDDGGNGCGCDCDCDGRQVPLLTQLTQLAQSLATRQRRNNARQQRQAAFGSGCDSVVGIPSLSKNVIQGNTSRFSPSACFLWRALFVALRFTTIASARSFLQVVHSRSIVSTYQGCFTNR